MKRIIMVGFTTLVFVISSCATPAGQSSLWTECVKANGYGFSMVTPYGPFNLGYLTWERNVSCAKDIKQASITDALKATVP
jgi:hypothetical protein